MISPIPQLALEAQSKLSALHEQLIDAPTVNLEAQVDQLRTQRDEALLTWFFEGIRSGIFTEPTPLPWVDPEDEIDEALDVEVFEEQTAELGSAEAYATVDQPLGELDLAALQAALGSASWQGEQQAAPLHPIFTELESLGPPPILNHEMSVHARAQSIDLVISDPRLFEVPKDQLLDLLIWLAAEARALQASAPEPSDGDARRIGRLVKVSHNRQPGFVHGLSRDHEPKTDHWTLDADKAWRALHKDLRIDDPEDTLALALVRAELAAQASPEAFRLGLLLALQHGVPPEHPTLQKLMETRPEDVGGRAFRRLRKASAPSGSQSGSVDVSQGSMERVPLDHPYRARLKNLSGVIVGGAPRPKARDRLQAELGLADLEWLPDDGPRGLSRLCTRIENGTVQLVFPLREFCSHATTDAVREACKQAGALHAPVTSGYGSNQLISALERAFAVH